MDRDEIERFLDFYDKGASSGDSGFYRRHGRLTKKRRRVAREMERYLRRAGIQVDPKTDPRRGGGQE
jgi:hypothetical protein